MDIDVLKRKLRELKKYEINTRFGGKLDDPRRQLVWNEFFSTELYTPSNAKYPLIQLAVMEKEQLREVFEEFFYFVYYRYYKENGLAYSGMYDPSLLAELGLSPAAGAEEIKKRFRQLAKKYHPDCGGDSERMIELLEVYKKLL